MENPQPVPHLVWPDRTSPEDLAQLYRAFLGREAEKGALQSAAPRPLHEVVAEMCASEEINRAVLHAIVQHRPLPHDHMRAATLQALARWLHDRLRCGGMKEDAAAERRSAWHEPVEGPSAIESPPPTPAQLLSTLYHHPAVAALLFEAHGSLFTQALEDLARITLAGAMRPAGKIEFVNREHISGWVVDQAAADGARGLQLHIRLKALDSAEDGRLVASAWAHSYRPDIHKLYGGSGLAGFRAKWDPRQFPHNQPVSLTLHEATTGVQVGSEYRFENSFNDQLTVAQMLAHEFETIKARLDVLAGMVPQALSYCAFPLEHYHYYRRAHRVPPPHWLVAWQEEERLRRRQAIALNRLAEEPPRPAGPHFTILLDATLPHASATAVRISVDGLREQQGWPHWQLHIVGDSPEILDVAALLAAGNPQVHGLPDWNAAFELVSRLSGKSIPFGPEFVEGRSDWLLLLQAGELLDENALAWLVQARHDKPRARTFYWDEDRLEHRAGHAPGRAPEHVDPILRTPFDPFSMLELNVAGTSFAAEANTLSEACALLANHPLPTPDRLTAAEPPPHHPHPLDAAERERLVWALHRQGCLEHLPRFLLTRTEEATAPDEPTGAERLIATAAADTLAPLLPPTWQHRTWQRQPDPLAPTQAKRIVHWQPQRAHTPISVLIPTRDRWQLVQQCVESLYDMAERSGHLEIVIADNGSSDPDTLAYLARETERNRLRVLRIDEPFNWSRLNNQMAHSARGEHMLFLNNDTRMLTRGWDAVLRGELEHPEIGAVGARLVYEDMSVQHAGVIFGYENFVGHAHVGQPTTGSGTLPLEPRTTRCASAVTGAFLACRREVFERVGLFNESELGVTFNDVEWCMRVMDAGLSVVYAPLIAMVHYESKSRGFDFESSDKQQRADYERARVSTTAGQRFLADPHRTPHLSQWAIASSSLT